MEKKFRRFLILAFCSFLLLFVSFFYPVLFHARSFAFRDAAHFYYPLYERMNQSLHHGELPLWDSYENLGQPLAANPASASFYPGKILFLLTFIPGISFTACWNSYLLIHFVLAFLLFYRLARQIGSRFAALIGSFAYTFGGPVFFQQSNPIFLVGAAWLPLIVMTGLDLLKPGNLRQIIPLAFALTMTFLGGDPQLAYMAFFLLLILYGFHLFSRKRKDCVPVRPRWTPFVLLFGSGFLAFLFSMVQFLPSWEMAHLSNRWEHRQENTTSQTGDSSHQKVLGRQDEREPLSPIEKNYRFSLPPWQTISWIFPRVGGEIFPINSRWSTPLSCGTGEWIGSLYFGLFPFLAVLAALFPFPMAKRYPISPLRIGILFSAGLLILGAFGAFGPRWVWDLFSGKGGALTETSSLGSLYGVISHFLPGFHLFRYPAKLMVPASFLLSLLAVIGSDRFTRRFPRGLFPILYSLLMVSTVGILLFFPLWGETTLAFCLKKVPKIVTVYGPLHLKRTALVLFQTFLQTGGMLLIFCFIRKWRPLHRFPQILRGIIILVLMVDLYCANHWQVTTFPVSILDRTALLAPLAERNQSDPPIRMVRSANLCPPSFLFSSSENRSSERVAWENSSGLSQFAARNALASLTPSGTMTPAGFEALKTAFFETPSSWKIREEALRFFGVRYLLLEPGLNLPKEMATRVDPTPTRPLPRGTVLWQMNEEGERMKIVHQEIPKGDLEEELNFLAQAIPNEGEEARYIRYEANHTEISVHLEEKGSVILTEQFWRGWRAVASPRIDGEVDHSQSFSVPIKPALCALRQIDLDRGDWIVEFRYQPSWLIPGLLISFWSVAISLGFFFFRVLKPSGVQKDHKKRR